MKRLFLIGLLLLSCVSEIHAQEAELLEQFNSPKAKNDLAFKASEQYDLAKNYYNQYEGNKASKCTSADLLGVWSRSKSTW